jgi:hypothetical protein
MIKNKILQMRYSADDERKLHEIVKYLNRAYGVTCTKSAAICALINQKHNDIKKGD